MPNGNTHDTAQRRRFGAIMSVLPPMGESFHPGAAMHVPSLSRRVPRRLSILVLPVALLCLAAAPARAQTKWVATWATAPEPLVSSQSSFNPPAPGLSGNSVRQVLRVSIGGDTLRMRFTNEYTNVPVTIRAATIAVSAGAGIIDTATTRFFRFSGQDSVVMPANAYVWSDPLAFPLEPGAQVQVTIHFGSAPASGTYPGITVHRGSRTTPRVLAGNQVSARTFAGASTIAQGSWVVSSMEVRAPQSAGAVAILGNSITDGYGVTTDGFNRWTDVFATRLLAIPGTRHVGVLNGGIGAGNMLSGGVSTPGLQRYQRDLFDHAGVKWVVIFLGVNDIGNAGGGAVGTVAQNLINAYAQIADSARARGIKAYGATITPFNGNGYYNAGRETARQTLNAWIRATDKLDGVIDFDRILRNPADTTRLLPAYNNDWLHPNLAGYAHMGNSVDSSLFMDAGSSLRPGFMGQDGFAVRALAVPGGNLSLRFTLPRPARVAFDVYSVQGRLAASLPARAYAEGAHAAELPVGRLSPGAYWLDMKADGASVARRMVSPAP